MCLHIEELENIKKLEQIDPILNPNGADKKAAEEVIWVLYSVIHSNTSDSVKDYTRKMIEAIKTGYEQQSGEKCSDPFNFPPISR